MEPGALAEFAAAAHVHKDLTDRFLEPMDVVSLSGRGGGEREAWKFSYLGRFFECWCKASRPEWHSCAFIGKNQLYVFISAIVFLFKASPHLHRLPGLPWWLSW